VTSGSDNGTMFWFRDPRTAPIRDLHPKAPYRLVIARAAIEKAIVSGSSRGEYWNRMKT